MLPWIQKQEYIENVGRLPQPYEVGEAELQWTYNPRTKKSREYFEEFCKNAKIERTKVIRTNTKQKNSRRKKKSY